MDQRLVESEMKHRIKEGEIKHTYFDVIFLATGFNSSKFQYPLILGKFLIGANALSVLMVFTGTHFEYFTPAYKDFKCLSFDVLGYFFTLTVTIQTVAIFAKFRGGRKLFRTSMC